MLYIYTLLFKKVKKKYARDIEFYFVKNTFLKYIFKIFTFFKKKG